MCLGLPRDCHTERLGKFWVKDMPLRVGTFTPDGRVAALHSSFAACCWATDRWKTSRTCYGLLRPRSGSRCTSGRWLVRRKKSEYWTGDGELTVFDDTAQPQGGPQPPKANGFWSVRKQRNLNAERPMVIHCSGSLGRWHIAGFTPRPGGLLGRPAAETRATMNATATSCLSALPWSRLCSPSWRLRAHCRRA